MNLLHNLPQHLDSPLITTLFGAQIEDHEIHQNYRQIILRLLHKILPHSFFEHRASEEESVLFQTNLLKKITPIISHSAIRVIPGTLSFFFLCGYRASSFKFFFEMISRWLNPGRRLNVLLVYAADFKLTKLSEESYTICEVMIEVKNQEEFEEIQGNFPLIESELLLGLPSAFYAQRILEIKGISADDKTAKIQEFISSLIQRFPSVYDQHIFSEMQHVLVTCGDEFKSRRQARHLGRIIWVQYLFRNILKESIKSDPFHCHVNTKIFRTTLRGKHSRKKVLGIFAAVHLLKDQKAVSEKQFLKTIQSLVPTVESVEHSFFIHRLGAENVCLSYIEIQKMGGASFSSQELIKLRSKLSFCLKNQIEHRLYPVFNHQNEEELMRNILTLADQIRYLRDIPQVLISFNEQAYTYLSFTVILARVLKKESCPLIDYFQSADTILEYRFDRKKIVGYLRKKYPKEASVFRLKLPKEGFVREDQSIDLYKARQFVVQELIKIIGEFRDYNGGMISKQYEILTLIRSITEINEKEHELLLEDFFYNLNPVVFRALIDPFIFQKMFLVLLKGIDSYKNEKYNLDLVEDGEKIFILIITDNNGLKDKIIELFLAFTLVSADFVFSRVQVYGNYCLCCLIQTQDQEKKKNILKKIRTTLEDGAETR